MKEFITNNSNTLIAFVIALFTLSSSFIGPLIKSKKGRTIAEVTTKILKSIPELIQTAEMITGLNGPQKKNFVMNQVKMILRSLGVEDSHAQQFDEEIDKLVALSKTVNVKPKSEVTYK